MGRLIHYMASAALVILVACGPLQAQEKRPGNNLQVETEKALREGMETILRALEHMIGSLPQYEMPEVLDNGDIIIRRKPREQKRDNREMTPDNGSST